MRIRWPFYTPSRRVFAYFLTGASFVVLAGFIVATNILHLTPQSRNSEAATPATAPINKRVYALIYNPVLRNGQKLNVYKGWSDPNARFNYVINYFKQLTNNRVNYSIVTTREINEWPRKIDGFTYTEDEYIRVTNRQSQPHDPDTADYYRFLNDPSLDICGRLNKPEGDAGKIDELWIIGGPFFGVHESSLATSPNGPKGFIYNGPTYDQTSCNKLLPMMGFSYEANQVYMIHDFAHRTEATMARVYASWDSNSISHNWNKFTLERVRSPEFPVAGCGTIHLPPNSRTTADDSRFDLTNTVSSFCDDFNGYPNIPYPPNLKTINCTAWGCTVEGYYSWWFRHLPHFIGTGTDGKLNDWWVYLLDPNKVPQPSNGTFSNLHAELFSNKAYFYFSYTGYSDLTLIDVSTDPEMNSNVFTFDYGTQSPIIELNPTRWNSYACSNTSCPRIYWRVRSSTGSVSPITATTVIRTTPTPTIPINASPTPTPFPTPNGAYKVYLPQLFKNADGGSEKFPAPGGPFVSAYAVQNMSDTVSANCGAYYYDSNGGLATYTPLNGIQPNKSVFVSVDTDTSIPNGRYSLTLSCDQKVAVVSTFKDTDGGSGSGAYRGYGVSPDILTTKWYIPSIYNNYYNYYSNVVIQNPSDTQITAKITIFDDKNNKVYCNGPNNNCNGNGEVIGPHKILILNQNGLRLDLNSSKDKKYSATITSSAPVSVAANMYGWTGNGAVPNGQLFSIAAIRGGAYTFYAPVIMNNYFSYNTALTIQNQSETIPTKYNVEYSIPGRVTTVKTTGTLAPNSVEILYTPNNKEIPIGSVASAKITSQSVDDIQARQLLGILVNESSPDNRAASYTGFTQGATTVFLPIVNKRYKDLNSSVTCQNVGQAAPMKIKYIDFAGNIIGPITTGTINNNQTYPFYQPGEPLLPNGFNGSAVISSTSQIICVVNQNKDEGAFRTTARDFLSTYEGIGR